MKRHYKWIVTPLCVLLLLVAARGCMAPLWYSSPALEARVVDADTGQPLEGVIAVAHWDLRGGVFHGATIGQLAVLETVTTADGQLAFPAWGPKLRPFFGHLELSRSPTLVVFKSGYSPAYPRPKESSMKDLAPWVLPLPDWHHTTIQMKKFDGSFEDYGKQLRFLEDELRFAIRSDDCLWKQIPRMLVAFDQEETRLVRAMGIPRGSESIEHWAIEGWDKSFSPAQVRQCGSMKDYLRSYLP